MEIEPILIEYAKRNSLKHNNSHQIIEKSILCSGLENDLFDLIIVRLVLEHIQNIYSAMNEIKRLLKPNGNVIIIDNDFDFHLMIYPRVEKLNKLYEAYCNARIEQGGHPKVGKELPSILKESGFEISDFRTIVAHSEVVGREIFNKSEGLGIATKLMKDNYLSSEDYTEIVINWSKSVKSEKYGIMRQLFVAVGNKKEEFNFQKYKNEENVIKLINE